VTVEVAVGSRDGTIVGYREGLQEGDTVDAADG